LDLFWSLGQAEELTGRAFHDISCLYFWLQGSVDNESVILFGLVNCFFKSVKCAVLGLSSSLAAAGGWSGGINDPGPTTSTDYRY
jgi:hypothetical protein